MPALSPPSVVDFLEAERERRGWVGRVRRLRGARLVTNPAYRNLLRANQVLVGITDPPVDWGELEAQAEPTLRAIGVPGRRVMLFGEEVNGRLGGQLSSAGFRPRALSLLTYRGLAYAASNPRVIVRLVDPFLRPALFTLSYRLEQETARPGEDVEESARLYAATSERPGLRSLAGFVGDTMAGSCDLGRVGSLAYVNHVQTAPEWRGQGVATTLVLRATDDAVREGVRGIQLTTRSPTLDEQLYRPCGYEVAERIWVYERGIPR